MKDLTAAAFSLFYLLDPKLGRLSELLDELTLITADMLYSPHISYSYSFHSDILVIGVGDNGNQLDFELIKELMKKRRLGLEILPTVR